MSIFDDMGRFLEERLDEFLKSHPHLELQVLEEKLKEQEMDTLRLIQELKQEEKNQQDAILETAEEVKRWHERVMKAQKAGRNDLMQAAQEREAQLLRQGNQQWGHMEMVKTRMRQTQELFQQIQTRRQEVKDQINIRKTQAKANKTSTSTSSSSSSQAWASSTAPPRGISDPLEERFRQWEIEDDLENLKRNVGK